MARKIIDPNQTNRCQRVPTSVVTLKFTKVESYRGHRVSHDGIAVIQTLPLDGSEPPGCQRWRPLSRSSSTQFPPPALSELTVAGLGLDNKLAPPHFPFGVDSHHCAPFFVL
eukprot:EG_transcript_23944